MSINKITPTNPVDSNISATPSAEDSNDLWLFYDSDSDPDRETNSKGNPADPGWDQLLSLHGIDRERIPDWIICTFPKMRYLPPNSDEEINLKVEQEYQQAIRQCRNETCCQDDDAIRYIREEILLTNALHWQRQQQEAVQHPNQEDRICRQDEN